MVDLGAAPGGWTQAVLSRVPNCNIIAIDVLPIEPIPGATIIRGDFTAEPTREAVKGLLTRGSVDVGARVLLCRCRSTTHPRRADSKHPVQC